MQICKHLFFCLMSICLAIHSIAQTDTVKPVKIAVFAPVYLDSVFSNDTYKPGKNNFPKYIVPGLDFYNGIMLAADSLNAEKVAVEILFYDSKSVESPLQGIVTDPEMENVSLIIASFNTRTEIKILADYALQKNIPLISSTYPNDGGINGNPFFVMVNPTLAAHIEAIYKYIHKAYPVENIILFRKKGGVEDMIQSTLANMNKQTPGLPLKLKTVELTDSFTTKQITDNLDSTKQNIVICGTLNESFGLSLSRALSSSKKYQSIVLGMPTWDGLKDIGKELTIIYTSAYNFTKNEKLLSQLAEKYKAKFAGRPGDMFLKGFESLYHFTKLLLKYPNGLLNHLSDKEYKLFNDFDFQPAKLAKESVMPDYLENRKLYFIRKYDGKVKSVN
jgi:hypothetical protein